MTVIFFSVCVYINLCKLNSSHKKSDLCDFFEFFDFIDSLSGERVIKKYKRDVQNPIESFSDEEFVRRFRTGGGQWENFAYDKLKLSTRAKFLP